MKSVFQIVLLLLPGWLFAQQPYKDLQLYILIGQSNMAGRGVVTPEYQEQGNDRVVMLNKENQWVKAAHPLHFDKPKAAGVGPGLTFGIAMAEASPGATIGLVPCAVGGTAIQKWRPGAYDEATKTHPWDDALVRIKEAMQYGTVAGVIWHQGEGNSNEADANTYLDDLSELIQRVRTVCNNPRLPFVVGELGRYRDRYALINKALVKLPSKVPNTTVVSSEGLWHKGDGTHFDSPSASEFGRRFAQGMLALQKKAAPHSAKRSSLSAKEKREGWELLLDGEDPNIRWRSIKGDAFPKDGWKVEKGMLTLLPGARGGDIITREQFSDFELSLEYKLGDSANTGVKYFVAPLTNTKGKSALNGPEFQLIDDDKHESVKDNKSPLTSTGAVYLLYAPQNKRLNPSGKWNSIRIVARGAHVEHWLNGKLVVSYDRGTEAFRQLVAGTKFKDYTSGYGEATGGYILLQDHDSQAWFRNIKIRRL
ncbi:sialate O-acetylesterase [Chitinophaga lutea]